MRQVLICGIVAAITNCLVAVGSASAGVIETLDFEDAAGLVAHYAAANPLGSFYQARYGVTFGNASVQDFPRALTSTGSILDAGIVLRYMAPYTEPPYDPGGPIYIDLNFNAASVSILAFRNWQPAFNHYVTMRAYDAVGDLLGTNTFSATTLGPGGSAIYFVPLAVTANDIRSIQLDGDYVGLGVVFDDLTITSMPVPDSVPDSVPEPVTLAVFGSGLVGVVAMRRRKKRAA